MPSTCAASRVEYVRIDYTHIADEYARVKKNRPGYFRRLGLRFRTRSSRAPPFTFRVTLNGNGDVLTRGFPDADSSNSSSALE